jgi:prevent-host-death family protein
MTEIPIFQAKNHLASIIHEAESGDSMKLTRHGKPAAMLIGMDEYERILGSGTGLVANLELWRRDWRPDGAEKDGSEGQDDDAFAGLRPAQSGRPVEL